MATTSASRILLASSSLLCVLACNPRSGLVNPRTPPPQTVAGQSSLSLPFVAHLEDVGSCVIDPPTPAELRALRVSDLWLPSSAQVQEAEIGVFAVQRGVLRWEVTPDLYFQAVDRIESAASELTISCDGVDIAGMFLLVSYPVEVGSLLLPEVDGFATVEELEQYSQERWEEAGSPLRTDANLMERLLDSEGDGECPTC